MQSKIRKMTTIGITALSLGIFSSGVSAALITNGFTYSVADAFTGPSLQGTHFHSSTGGDFGNPSGKAEVGGFGNAEEVRGVSEYDITGISSGGPAFVSFDVYLMDGLFGQGGGSFDIDIFSYVGNNLENVSDWEAASTGSVATFSTGGLPVGDTLSFDVASLLDAAITNLDTSFGIRLQQSTRNVFGPAYTFENFRLTTTDDTTAVPEPATLALFGIGLAGMGFARKKKKSA